MQSGADKKTKAKAVTKRRDGEIVDRVFDDAQSMVSFINKETIEVVGTFSQHLQLTNNSFANRFHLLYVHREKKKTKKHAEPVEVKQAPRTNLLKVLRAIYGGDESVYRTMDGNIYSELQKDPPMGAKRVSVEDALKFELYGYGGDLNGADEYDYRRRIKPIIKIKTT